MIVLDIATFLGRLHPLMVHLPIGFLLLAILFNFLSYLPAYRVLKEALPVSLLIGFIAAVLAGILGLILSYTGEYNARLLKSHKVSGIGVAILSGVLYIVSTNRFKHYVKQKFFSIALVLLFILLAYSGHQGGTLTHGSGYLSMKTLMEQKRTKPARIEDTYIFEDVIVPILEEKCSQCHQGNKLKGNLSVATLADLKKGGKHGAAIVAGNLDKSELYKRITLTPDHKEFMPADGKPPLTKTEAQIITWWIQEARAVENRKLIDLAHNSEIVPQIASFLKLSDSNALAVENRIAENINSDIPLTADQTQIQALKAKGFVIRVMLQKPLMLDVTLPARSSIKFAGSQPHLKVLSKNIIWLNLSDNNLTDMDVVFLKDFVNLEKLRLEKNPLTDEVCKNIVGLKHLNAVNLNETLVTDEGIRVLSKNAIIKRIYSWKTAVKKL